MSTLSGLCCPNLSASSRRGMYSTLLPGSIPNDAVTTTLGYNGKSTVIEKVEQLIKVSIIFQVQAGNLTFNKKCCNDSVLY